MDDTQDADRWDERAGSYDAWYETFEGAVEHAVDWELLSRHLPDRRCVSILDAAGGTGRISLPLAELGHNVTLCDKSPAMLSVAGAKMARAGVQHQVHLQKCDVRDLPFADESFDFVICWDGGAECVGELARVARKGADISAFFVNRWAAAIARFGRDPSEALALADLSRRQVTDEGVSYEAADAAAAERMFQDAGIRPVDTYAVCGWMDVLQIPDDVRRSREWDAGLFTKAVHMALRLSEEPSVRGMSRHLVVYGRRP